MPRVILDPIKNLLFMFQPKSLLPLLLVVSIAFAPTAIAQGKSSLSDENIETPSPSVPTDYFGSGDAKLPSWAAGNRGAAQSEMRTNTGPQHKSLKWHSSDTSGDSINNWGKTNANCQQPQGTFNIDKQARGGQQNNPFNVGPRFTPRDRDLGISQGTQPMMTRRDMSKIQKNNSLLSKVEEYKALKRKSAEEWCRKNNVKMPNSR